MMLLERKLKQSTETYHDTIEKDYACFIKLDDDETMFYNSHFCMKSWCRYDVQEITLSALSMKLYFLLRY